MSRDLTQTHNYPLNRSISKQLYSFPKATRFQTTPESLCQSSFYQIKRGAMGNRTTTFGYGNKMEMVNKTPAPPVGKYQLNDQFHYNRQKRRGYSFSRDSKANILVNPQKTSKIPGPGTYNHNRLKSIDKYATFSYSMGGRIQDPNMKYQNSLGPGQYELNPSITPNGSYFVSKYANSGCSKVGKAKRRSINDPSITPGPGKYQNESKLGINNTGVYFYSKFRTVQSSKFSRSNRPPLGDTKPVPGPGAYGGGQFSQFAHLNKSWARNSSSLGR